MATGAGSRIGSMANWWHRFRNHHDAAFASAPGGVVSALLSIASVLLGMLLELRRIRKQLERGRVTAIGLTASTTTKEGPP